MITKTSKVGALLCVAVLGLCAGAWAAIPPDAIHYQGVLRDAAGEPLDGTYDMVFRFWSAESGGEEILVDTHDAANGNPIAVDDGLLSVQLGQGVVSDGSGAGTYTSLTDVFRDYSEVWLAIEVNGEVLSPRVQVISAGHALNARNAENAEVLVMPR
jgi:hypothetical protein